MKLFEIMVLVIINFKLGIYKFVNWFNELSKYQFLIL